MFSCGELIFPVRSIANKASLEGKTRCVGLLLAPAEDYGRLQPSAEGFSAVFGF